MRVVHARSIWRHFGSVGICTSESSRHCEPNYCLGQPDSGTKNSIGSTASELGDAGGRTPTEVDRLVAEFCEHVGAGQRKTAQPHGRMGRTETQRAATSSLELCGYQKNPSRRACCQLGGLPSLKPGRKRSLGEESGRQAHRCSHCSQSTRATKAHTRATHPQLSRNTAGKISSSTTC